MSGNFVKSENFFIVFNLPRLAKVQEVTCICLCLEDIC